MSSKLKYDPAQVVPRPYPADVQGGYVLNSHPDVLEMVLLKSPVEGEILGKIYFGKKSAGPPGHVHGGCQAAVLDEMMGSCGWYNGMGVVAAKIEVEFVQMVPYENEIDLAARVVQKENRKVTIVAELWFRGEMVAHSKGLFIILTNDKLKHLGLNPRG